ncbi:MAG TPA: PAS domain-containing protein, partial [Kiloniellales bacterium]|nr:PAS domain-containing protein [Kiloniellales bacterium]
MTTEREFAENATAAVCGLLQISPAGNAEDVTDVIELALKKAAREHESTYQDRVRQFEAEVRDRFKHLLSSAPAVIYAFNTTGGFEPTFVSENIRTMFGYEPGEYLENPNFWRERVHPDDLARVEAEITRLFGNGTHGLEYRFRRKDGSYCWVSDEQHLIRDEHGRALEIVGSWSDITTRKEAEEAVAQAKARLTHLVNASPAVIYSFNATGNYEPTFVSETIRKLLGYEPSEYLGDPNFWRDRVHPDDLARVEEEITRLFGNGIHSLVYRFRRKDGAYCWVSDEQHLIRDEAGDPSEIVGSWNDITERKTAEEALAQAKARLTYLVNASPAVIYSFDATGDYEPTFVSENIRKLLGYEPEDYLHDPDFWRRSIHPQDLDRVLDAMPRLFEEGHLSQDYRFRRSDGGYSWVNDELQLIRDADGLPLEVVGAWSDVTAQRRVGEALVNAQNRLNHILSSSPAVIYSFEA